MKYIKWFRTNWWIFVLFTAFFIASISIFTPYEGYVVQWADTLTKLLTPISILLGLILGYPLIKKKLTEQYVTKQFEIMDNSNREVRKKVITLLDRYKVEYISNRLTLEYINEALNQITDLKQTAIDASPDVYRYVNLIHRMLTSLSDIYSKYSKAEDLPHQNYKEQLSTWLHYHLNEVFDYSKTIGVIPSGEVLHKRRLNSFLSKFVTRNDLVEIKDVTPNIEYYHNEAMLVIYFEKSLVSLSEDNFELLEATYLAAPSPSPFARLLLNNSIYFPPVLQTKDKIIFDYGKLNLIGYKRKKSTPLGGGLETVYYECCYSNTSNISYVGCIVKTISDLEKLVDSYLDIPFFSNGISNLSIHGETICFRICVDEARKRFEEVHKKLKKTIKKEV